MVLGFFNSSENGAFPIMFQMNPLLFDSCLIDRSGILLVGEMEHSTFRGVTMKL